jgi:hypothetical protein
MRKAITRFAVVTLAAPVAARALQRLADALERRQGHRGRAADVARRASHTLNTFTRRRW